MVDMFTPEHVFLMIKNNSYLTICALIRQKFDFQLTMSTWDNILKTFPNNINVLNILEANGKSFISPAQVEEIIRTRCVAYLKVTLS